MDNRKSELLININRNWKMILTKKNANKETFVVFIWVINYHEPFLISFLRFSLFFVKLSVFCVEIFENQIYFIFVLLFILLCFQEFEIFTEPWASWSWLLSISWVFSFLSVLVKVQLFFAIFFSFVHFSFEIFKIQMMN